MTDRLHQPVVDYLGGGAWGAYCDACSVKAGGYVYPCQEPTHCQLGNYWPPAKLYEREPGEP